jgi:hypothetical protein
MSSRTVFTIFTLLMIASLSVAGTSVEKTLLNTEDGRVLLSFETRDNVYGAGRSIRVGDDDHRVHIGDPHCDDDDWNDDERWERGPLQMLLKFRDGDLRGVDARVGVKKPRYSEDLTDLGLVPPAEAAAALMALARRGSGRALDELLFPMSVAKDVEIWPELLSLARDRGRSEDLRESAVFWLGQAAGEAAAKGLTSLLEDEDEELEIREHAIFSLSQRDTEECLPVLTRIATSSPHPQLREQALFWLSQHDDPRVLALFEEILLGN